MTKFQRFSTIGAMFCLSLALFLTGCTKETTPTSPTTGTTAVSGVLQNEQGYVIPEAVIEAYSASNAHIETDTTDLTGAFTLKQLPSSLTGINLRISHPDFHLTSVDLPSLISKAGGATGGKTPGVAVTMASEDSCCGSLGLYVRAGDHALGGAEVAIRHGDHTLTVTHTDSTGFLTFYHLCPGSYNVRISKSGYSVVEHSFGIEHCDSASLTLSLTATSDHHTDSCCNGLLTINVHDSASNDNINGATVTITRSGVTRTATSAEGHVTFHEMCAGSYVVHVIGNDHYHGIEFSQTMTCNDTESVTKLLPAIAHSSGSDSCCNGVVELTVLDSATGHGLQGATVHLYKSGTLLTTLTTGDAGGVRFAHLCEGSYRISISKTGFTEQGFEFGEDCNATHGYTRTLAEVHSGSDSCCNASIHVNVGDSTYSDGHWLNGTTVTIKLGDHTIAHGTTSGEGGFAADGICGHHTYTITFSKDGFNTKTVEMTLGDCHAYSETYRLSPH